MAPIQSARAVWPERYNIYIGSIDCNNMLDCTLPDCRTRKRGDQLYSGWKCLIAPYASPESEKIDTDSSGTNIWTGRGHHDDNRRVKCEVQL